MTPEEYQLLLELGQYDDRSGALDRQQASFANMRQPGAPIQIGNLYGLSTLLTSIRDAGNNIAGVVGDAGVEKQRQKLLQRRTEGLAVGNKLAAASAPNVSGLFDPNATPDDLQIQEAGVSAQLAEHEKKARMLMQTGDPVLAQQGQMMMQQVQEAKGQMLAAPEKRLSRASQQQALLKSRAEFERMNGPATREHHMLAQKYGTQIPEGATVAQAEQVLEIALQGHKADIEQRKLGIDAARLGQDSWSAIADPVTGRIIRYNKKTGETSLVDAVPGAAGYKPLTESQGQAAMFLDQAQQGMRGAMELGKGIMPTSGIEGVKEQVAWEARSRGVPQISSKEEAARQSILLSIAEPIVRAESGAAVPADEVRRLAIRYVPMPGEHRVEQHRKLKALVNAIGSVMQKLPAAKAAEFKPFHEQAKRWAAALESDAAPSAGGTADNATPSAPGAPAPLQSPDSYYE